MTDREKQLVAASFEQAARLAEQVRAPADLSPTRAKAFEEGVKAAAAAIRKAVSNP